MDFITLPQGLQISNPGRAASDQQNPSVQPPEVAAACPPLGFLPPTQAIPHQQILTAQTSPQISPLRENPTAQPPAQAVPQKKISKASAPQTARRLENSKAPPPAPTLRQNSNLPSHMDLIALHRQLQNLYPDAFGSHRRNQDVLPPTRAPVVPRLQNPTSSPAQAAHAPPGLNRSTPSVMDLIALSQELYDRCPSAVNFQQQGRDIPPNEAAVVPHEQIFKVPPPALVPLTAAADCNGTKP